LTEFHGRVWRRNWLDFGGDPDSIVDCGSQSRILYHQEIAAVLSPVYVPGGRTIHKEVLRSIIASSAGLTVL